MLDFSKTTRSLMTILFVTVLLACQIHFSEKMTICFLKSFGAMMKEFFQTI